ncbi:hypothetical protein [Natronococcus wangiae]|uniref:hypothetical protein n=1 Tax=Natronococcus wangiae TaxID=3068275 RepID=UPI0027400BAC|nr:hypothetical protein [Natronococcus sp. AD5]
MATGRALTTEYERECIRGEHGDQRKYEAKSRVKRRINDVLSEDVELFAEHAEGLNDELQAVVCVDSGDDE